MNTTNSGVDVVIDYQKKISNKERFKLLFVANFQGINIDDVHVPAAIVANGTAEEKEYKANVLRNKVYQLVI